MQELVDDLSKFNMWFNSIGKEIDEVMEAKRLAAEKAVEYVKDGMVVGLGTGSTTYYAIQKLGLKIKQGLKIKAIATSQQSAILGQELGIELISFAEVDQIDVTIDGADEVNPQWHLIKGGGGALLREKIVAAASSQLIIVVDHTKVVDQLGKFPLPLEIVPFGYEMTLKLITNLGCQARLRTTNGEKFITDNGNYIVDCNFDQINEPNKLNTKLNLIPGVVENGLFIDCTTKVIVGYEDGSVIELQK